MWAHYRELFMPLFEKYGITLPADTSAKFTSIPETLSETFTVGVEAEIKNIEMYKSFLETDLPQDVSTVFERLMQASENHLKAFERVTNIDSNSKGFNNKNSLPRKMFNNQSTNKGTGARIRNINRNVEN